MAIAAWPIGTSQARIRQARERAKQNQIECEEQREHHQGTHFQIHIATSIFVEGPQQRDSRNEKTDTEQTRCGAEVVQIDFSHSSRVDAVQEVARGCRNIWRMSSKPI